MSEVKLLPGISGWNRYAGGTAAAEGKYSYDIRKNGVQWSIQPVSYQNGRHMGYTLWAFGLPKESGYVWFDRTGAKNYVGRGLFNSPQSAAKVAREQHAIKIKRGY